MKTKSDIGTLYTITLTEDEWKVLREALSQTQSTYRFLEKYYHDESLKGANHEAFEELYSLKAQAIETVIARMDEDEADW